MCSDPVTIAKIPARTVSGRSGQAATTAAKSGSSTCGPVALSVAREGREPPLTVASWRRSALSWHDATHVHQRIRRVLTRAVAC